MIDADRYPVLAAGGTWHWGVDIDWRFLPYSEDEDRDVSGVRVVAFAGEEIVLSVFEWPDGRREAAPPGGTLEEGEHWVSAAIRELREEAVVRLLTLHPFGILEIRSHSETAYRPHLPHPTSRRVLAWADVVVDGRPEPVVGGETVSDVLVLAADHAVARALADQSDGLHAELIRLACEARGTITDTARFRDGRILLENAYLATDDPYLQSGKSGGASSWEEGRRFVVQALHRDGSFLDLGCANGLLMESVARWAPEDRDLAIEPYGLDISERLAQLARHRLPQWADRIWVGNALDWKPPFRFDFVHAMPDVVFDKHRAEWIARLRREFLKPGGRLLLRSGDPRPPVGGQGLREMLAEAGVRPGGWLEQRRSHGGTERLAWFLPT